MSPRAGGRWDVVVLGAGAAGLFCAAACARRGRATLVLDHAARSAAKVRVSGGGRCNFTNLGASADHYLSANPRFASSALARFPPRRILELLERRGVPYVEREAGQLFCARGAGDLAALLEAGCREAGATLRLGCAVAEVVAARDGGFTLRAGGGELRTASLVVATGGLSYPALGASGLGHDLARQFGLAVVPPRPALVPFLLAEAERAHFRGLAGVALEAEVSCGGKAFRGGVLFTHRGLSGPAVLQASLSWSPGAPVAVDLLPGVDLPAALRERGRGGALVRTALAGLLPKRLAEAWCERQGVAGPVNRLPERALRELATGLHAWTFVPRGTEGYATAEVTAGGVDTAELSSKTMEARRVPGLYFVGEVMDVTGELGGYNLHWAWASAHAAGQYA